MKVKDRFLKYVSFDTTSDENSATVPSTAKQLALGKYLAEELKNIGLENAEIDEFGYVYGFLPATKGREDEPTVGLIAHMDTSSAVSGENIKPKTVLYQGGDITLDSGVVTDLNTFPFISKYVGEEIIVSDGTTLLGADDKAGVAEIFTACEYLINNPEIAHGRIAVGITPDEEIGSGADHFNLEKFGAKWGYTVDGGELGEIEYENFNGASAKVKVNGVNIHPGSAKNKMKNASLIGAELIAMLPESETPAHTENYEGFYHLTDIKGDETSCFLNFIIRDHSKEIFEKRKDFFRKTVDFLNEKYGKGTVELNLTDSYYNMKEKILPCFGIIESAKAAMLAVGVEPIVVPIRGGTDGARLSYEGLPCPNLSTGGMNFHGIHEMIPVKSMEKMVEVLIKLVTEKR